MKNESEIVVEEQSVGKISKWLTTNGFAKTSLPQDKLGIEVIKVNPSFSEDFSQSLKEVQKISQELSNI